MLSGFVYLINTQWFKRNDNENESVLSFQQLDFMCDKNSL